MNRSALPALAFAGCGLVWGSTFLAIRVGDESLPAIWSCALRLGLAAVLLSLLLVATKQSWPRGEALKAACLYGLIEFGIQLPLLYWGEKEVSSGLSAVVYATGPIAAMFGAKVLGMENWNPRKLIAAVIALSGVALIYWRQFGQGDSVGGFLAVLGAAFLAPWAGLMLERGPKQNAIGANAVGTWVGLPFACLGSFLVREAHPFPETFREAFPVIYLAVMSSAGAFVLFAWLINHWPMTTVAFLGVIVPVIAVCAGALVLKEHIAPGALVGAAVVFAGVVLALTSNAGSSKRLAEAVENPA